MLDDYAVFIRDVNMGPAFIGYFLTQRREECRDFSGPQMNANKRE
jgi:hypothetical protein